MNQELKWEEIKTGKRKEKKEVKRNFMRDFPKLQAFTSKLQIKQTFNDESREW